MVKPSSLGGSDGHMGIAGEVKEKLQGEAKGQAPCVGAAPASGVIESAIDAVAGEDASGQ